MPEAKFDYAACVSLSERVAWRLDDVLREDQALDFSRRFLPEALAGVEPLAGLDARTKLQLNQIRGRSYLHLFNFVEEYIVANTVQHAQAEMFGDDMALRALLRFADEEVKHQQLFQRFGRAFGRGFGSSCELVGSAEEVAGTILGKSPLAVQFATLHLELVTQQHYVESVKDNEGEDLDPLFKSLLKHHWLEEAQHAKIDILEIEKLSAGASAQQRERALDDYEDIVRAFGGVLDRQAELDVESLGRALGRPLPGAALDEVLVAQRRAYRRTFLSMGMTNAQFVARLDALTPGAPARVAALAAEVTA